MESEKSNRREHLRPVPRWGRPFSNATAVVFLISSVFPIVAMLSMNTAAFPLFWGRLDVGFAFLLAIMAFTVQALARGRITKDIEQATYRLYRIFIHGIFILLLVFFLFGDRIIWANGLTGIAWRAWLLLYILPDWLVVSRLSHPHPGGSNKPYGHSS
jgi:hypothetical protein